MGELSLALPSLSLVWDWKFPNAIFLEVFPSQFLFGYSSAFFFVLLHSVGGESQPPKFALFSAFLAPLSRSQEANS